MTDGPKGDREVAFSVAARAGVIAGYAHPGGRLGSLVEVACRKMATAEGTELRRLAQELALQVAAADPRWVDRAAMRADPAAAGLTLSEGEACRRYCLMEQPWIKDPARTVGQWLAEAALALQDTVWVVRFARFERPRVFCTWYGVRQPSEQ